MTNQDFFNKVWERAKDPVRASEPGLDSCYYRAPNGEACFVGVCIPDAYYCPEMEGCGAEEIAGYLPDVFGEVDLCLLCDCQNIHDCFDPPDWPKELHRVAAQYNLEVPC